LKVKIIAPGKIKEKWMRSGIEEYKKRLSRYCSVEMIEVQDSPDSVPAKKALADEADRILARIKDNEIVWVMDLHGKLMTSEEISSAVIKDMESGGSSITVVIGGSNGLDPGIVKRADRRICFGNITLTHQMTRLVLLEQIYRGFKIAAGEKYHK